MDAVEFRRFADSVKAFFLRKASREALVFVVFLLVSAGFWLLQTMNETYETEFSIPLRLTNIPEGTVVTTDLPEQLHVTLRDRGMVLWRYSWNSKRPLDIDFSSRDNGSNYGRVVVSHSEVQKQLLSVLEPTTQISNVRPDTLEYYYTRGKKKRVAVRFNGRVETAPLYYLAGLNWEPDSVTVWADESMLDSLTCVTTMQTTITDLSETTVRQVPILRQRGVKVDPDAIVLRATVDVYTQKQVTVPIVGINFPGGYMLRTFPSMATLSFRVGSLHYKEVTADDFALTVTYEELMARPDSMLKLQLRTLPDGVSQVHIQPEFVQFMIEQEE